MNWLINTWYRPHHPLTYTLAPISFLYRSVTQIRALAYQNGFKKIIRFPVPVIVVGNLTVGGTGKTPLVCELVRCLSEEGYRPGIVSRGYGGKAKTFPQWVTADSDPVQVGDEPVLLAQKTNCPLVVAPKRAEAVAQLLAKSNCNIVISDDGLQHYALGRDIEIAVIDGERRFGNEHCLPAGPLREPSNRLRKVDFLVTHGNAQPGEFAMKMVAEEICQVQNHQQKLSIHSICEPIHAVAGVGNPPRFFRQLRQMGLTVIEHPFPDHHRYRSQDIDFGEQAVVVMTEKDAVKCRKLADHRHWCLPVSLECDPNFMQALLEKLAKLKSREV